MITDAIEDFEVYVGEEAIREVHLTPNFSLMQTFGEDWTSTPIVQIHPLSPRQQLTGTSAAPRKFRPLLVKPGIEWGVGVVIAILASICAWGILSIRLW
ncbi:MAG: hypothetical protein ABSF14_19740 [Terriglobia bacterium]|jgi:hypothetical protein